MENNQPVEQRVLTYVSQENYQPVKPGIIARKIGLAEEEFRELKRAIKRLVKTGQLVYGPKHLILKGGSVAAIPSPSQGKTKAVENELIGRFSRASGGYGFVSIVPAPGALPGDELPEDIFIPQNRTLDAAKGDIVRVQISSRREGPRQRISGQITEIIERRTHRFVGTYREQGKIGRVTIDGNQFESDVLVGDAGARAAKVGDKVIVEMVRFPGQHRSGHLHPGEAVIVQVLGDRGQPGVDTLIVIAEFGLPGEFSEVVLADARGQAEKFDETIDARRTDFTSETVITIDPLTARDFDDAISLTKIGNGHWQLGVHIADVSHFVRPNSELDNEAFRRATSVYLPDRVIPMLPEVISNNLASLQPDRVRYTMTALIEFSDEGVPISTELYRSAIRSQHRFNYEEIDQYLSNDKPWKKKLAPDVFRLVRDMHTLAMKLRKRRMDRGSFDLTIPEIEIDLDVDGRVSGAHTRENTESHQIIEEFMLAANEAVAQRLVDMELHLMRRIHEPPAPAKLADLKTLMSDLGFPADNIQSRFELKRIIESSRGTSREFSVHYAILRAMQKAVYSPREVGHYALASEAYCHFTSPIRRYPDLIIHRMVGAIVDGKKPASNFGLLQQLGSHCSELEQRAEQAERELIKLKLINFLHDKVGMEMDAVITGVEQYGLFAQGTELPATGFISIDSLPNDRYFFDRGTRTLQGHRPDSVFRLGNPVRIRVVSADPDRREVEYALVSGSASSARSSAGRHYEERAPAVGKSSQSSGDRRAFNKKGASKSQAPTGSRFGNTKGKRSKSNESSRTRKPQTRSQTHEARSPEVSVEIQKQSPALKAPRKSIPRTSAQRKGIGTKSRRSEQGPPKGKRNSDRPVGGGGSATKSRRKNGPNKKRGPK